MGMKHTLQLRVTEKKYLVGFENYVRTRLTPVVINGEERPPRPNSVRKVLSGERESRRMLLDIFQNGTDLMRHPSVGTKVMKVFEHWRAKGELPKSYGDWKRKG